MLGHDEIPNFVGLPAGIIPDRSSEGQDLPKYSTWLVGTDR
jgi:hypothetical protein